ncbi:hypothetical protein PIB30_027786 [Stylosanthes scabra]|uniref:Uncharacterized protein n=1 Tax=Stylosanthes scabra TaxID=79078 RepID=A0ABU6RB00_9FABA|nr:hypothetical protein [Stylosanthes scabra]
MEPIQPMEEVSSNFQEEFMEEDADQEQTETVVAETASAVETPNSDRNEEDPTTILVVTGSFIRIDFATLSVEDMKMIEFVDLQTAYNLYNEYGRVKGFSIRRSKVGRSKTVGSEEEIT